MARSETFVLDFTGSKSHTLEREPGRGDIVVGPRDGRSPPDLLVAPDAPLNWHVFDGMHTGAGGAWPRWISYEGSDASLFDWTRDRATENIRFAPTRDMDLDLSEARLVRLALYPRSHRLRLTLPRALRELFIAGDPACAIFSQPRDAEHELAISFEGTADFRLATLGSLPHLARSKIHRLSIINEALSPQPFDCRCLVDLPQLTSLALHGAMCHLDALSRLPLENLELRFVPDLAGLPDLSVWPRLSQLIAWNVEETAGRALQKALEGRPVAKGTYFTVSQLRSRHWFIEEHGLPFAAWKPRSAKAASKAFKAAGKLLRQARAKEGARKAITGFVKAINALPGIETSEREDAANAVGLLAAVRPDLVTVAEAERWFDAAREF